MYALQLTERLEVERGVPKGKNTHCEPLGKLSGRPKFVWMAVACGHQGCGRPLKFWTSPSPRLGKSMGGIGTECRNMGTAAYFACCACEAELKKSFSGKR